MIADILKIVIGIPVALFIPGWLIVSIFFRELKILEKIAFSIAFSIMLDIAIAIFFGYNEAQALRTGGLTFTNIVYAELIIMFILALILIIIFIIEQKRK